MGEESKIEKTLSDILERDPLKPVYFIGIGGIGMSAIARFFCSMGIGVSGYDKTRTELTAALEAEGMNIHYEENIALIPEQTALVVYTPAVPENQTELQYCRKKGFRMMKRSEVLELITGSSFNICIAGTHGKTTITSMTAHILRDSGFGCTAFLGGIAVNYGSNFWPQQAGSSSEKKITVIEADEYDRSFLKLNPDIAIISAMDPDHLDIYGSADAMEQAFIDFAKKIKPGGMLVTKFGLKRGKELLAGKKMSYSLQNESADIYAADIRMMQGSYFFDVLVNEKRIPHLELHMGGLHNVENAVAAIAVASSLGIEEDKIRKALAAFRGVKRRFEYVFRNEGIVFIDDYAHHPEELQALIRGARSLFTNRKCTVIFQPHLYSRTRDLADGFAAALDTADEVILLPVYPARELPVAGVDSEMILARMKKENKTVMTKDRLIDWIQNDFIKNRNKEFGEVLITAGAGDIDQLVEPLKEILIMN